MSKFHILVVEDEKDISDILKVELEENGHRVTVIEDGAKALEYIQDPSTKDIHLCILDRMLPNISGLEICQFMRMFKETKYVSILMLTAMARPEHIVEGLEAGADDYVTKPFDTPVLMARVRNLIKRSQLFQSERDKETGIFEMNKLKVDTHQCKAWIEHQELELTLSEYKLLVAFLQSPGKVLTRNQLVQFIQDGPVHVTGRTIDTHIFGLRKKLKDHAQFVETIRGVGYRVAPKA